MLVDYPYFVMFDESVMIVIYDNRWWVYVVIDDGEHYMWSMWHMTAEKPENR